MAAVAGGLITPLISQKGNSLGRGQKLSSPCLQSSNRLPQTCSVKAQIATNGSGTIPSLEEHRESDDQSPEESVSYVTRRGACAGIAVMAASLVSLTINSENAFAVQQTLLAGRIPGLSDPDQNGLRTYRRPDAKSGGHGVGWSPMVPYSFKVPQDWEEVPVSIADLGGTEIDLRFTSQQEGNISVVVAPVLRFSSTIGDNATIEAVGTPEKVISAFGPEITGQNVEGKVKDMDVKEYNGRKYYQYELDPHVLITATAAGNRLYLMSVTANGRQWKKFAPDLKQIVDSFRVG